MKRILLLLQLAFTTVAFGAGSVINYPSVSATNTVQTTVPTILVPPTNNLLSGTGTVQAKITPGGLYSISASINSAVLSSTANVLTSCTTTAGSRVVSASVKPSVGQIICSIANFPAGTFCTDTSGSGTFMTSLPAITSGSVTLSLTAGSFIAPVQTSVDGTNWTTVSNLIPKTYGNATLLTGTIVTPGLYMYQAGPNDNYIRVDLTGISITGNSSALTSLQVRFNIDSWDKMGAQINLPYINYSSASAVMPVNIPQIPPIDLSGLCDIELTIGPSNTASFRLYMGDDDTGIITTPCNGFNVVGGISTTAYLSTPGVCRLLSQARYLFSQNIYSSATVTQVSGATAKIGTTTTAPIPSSVNLGTVGNNFSFPGVSALQGQLTYNGMYVCLGVPASLIELNGISIAGVQRYSTNASAYSFGGVSISADILFTITTLGASTGIVPILQQSSDGSTWTDVWKGLPVSTTSHQQMPAVLIDGQHRFACESLGGNATTATITVNAKELPATYPPYHQFVDFYSSTNPSSTVINGGTTATTLVSTSVNSTSAPAYIDKCKSVTISGLFTGGTPTIAPIYTLQVSNDTANWKSTTCTMTPTSSGYFTSDIQLTGCYRYARLIVSTASTGGTPYTATYTAINSE